MPGRPPRRGSPGRAEPVRPPPGGPGLCAGRAAGPQLCQPGPAAQRGAEPEDGRGRRLRPDHRGAAGAAAGRRAQRAGRGPAGLPADPDAGAPDLRHQLRRRGFAAHRRGHLPDGRRRPDPAVKRRMGGVLAFGPGLCPEYKRHHRHFQSGDHDGVPAGALLSGVCPEKRGRGQPVGRTAPELCAGGQPGGHGLSVRAVQQRPAPPRRAAPARAGSAQGIAKRSVLLERTTHLR